MSRAGRDRRAGALLAPRTETQRGRSMIEIDYWAEAAAMKRAAGRLKGIVPQVRRLATVKSAAERRSARLALAAELAGIGARFFELSAQIVGDREDDPKTAGWRDELRTAARRVVGENK